MESKVVTFCQDNLKCTSFLAFEEMRKKGELCDLTLKIQHNTIRAHRVVLAAAIPYFRSLFTKDGDAVEEEKIAVGHLDPNTFESLIDFAYNARVNISVENAQTLLRTSEFLQLKEVTNACVEFLSERLNVGSILEVCTLACNVNNQRLTQNCSQYIQENFEEFAKCNDFLSLPYACIKDVISSDELNTSDEETVFEAVIQWVKYSLEERQNMLPDLLREVRMCSLPVSYLVKHVVNEELVKSSAACRDLIQVVQNFHLLPEENMGLLNVNLTPRKNMNGQIYAIGYSKKKEHSVYCCDFSRKKWKKVNSIKSDKDNVLHVAAANGCIYIFLNNRIRIFDLKNLKWEVLEPIHEGLEGSAVLAHGNRIYCFGSCHDLFFNKVRCFDTLQKKWLEETLMDPGRGNSAATSLKESIYVTGGYSQKTLSTFEKYNPSNGQCCQLPAMLTPRSLHGCAGVEGKIYVFGGGCRNISYECFSNSGEVYDTVTGMWNTISCMSIKRNRFSYLSHSGKIYVLGSQTETGNHSQDVEFYDPKCDQWRSGISVPETVLGAVVM